MSTESIVQIVIGITSICGTIFGAIRYVALQTAKREKALLEHTEKTQQSMLEYFETKNGHMERMSNRFADTAKDLSSSINNLATKIEVMHQSSKK